MGFYQHIASYLMDGAETNTPHLRCGTPTLPTSRFWTLSPAGGGKDEMSPSGRPTGRMAHATIFDDSGKWWATKLAPAVVEQ